MGPLVDHDDAFLLEEFAGLRRCQELVVGPALPPAAVNRLGLLVAGVGMNRPLA
jgi:hypothetical protein